MLTEGAVLKERYQINRILSEKGGMGVVYKATDLTFRNTVVLKQSRFSAKDKMLSEAFEREARLLNGLRHGALPHVIDYFKEELGQFLVMQFIPGQDLGEMLDERLQRDEGPFPVAQVLRWADQLLDALDYLHSHQPPVIHRDIKPQNMKLTPRGEIILLDFGLAKGASSEMTVASVSVHGYTPTYAPLEQIRGTGTGQRSDLYALATTLHHLLTGQSPPDAVTRVSETIAGDPDPLRPPHELNPAIPVAISDVIYRGAALAPNDRPRTASVMREALRDASTGAGPNLAAVSTMVGSSTADALITSLNRSQATQLGAPSTPPPSTPSSTSSSTSSGPAAAVPSVPGTTTFTVSKRRLSVIGAILGVAILAVVGAIFYFNASRSTPPPPPAASRILDRHSRAILSVAFSPFGRRLAAGSADSVIRLWDAETWEPKEQLTNDDANAFALAFSPDGKLLASGHQYNAVNIWDLRAGKLLKKLEGHDNVVDAVVFSPDSKRLASGSWNGNIKIWDIATGENRQTLTSGHAEIFTLACSPDGKYLASSGTDGAIHFWEMPGGTRGRTFKDHDGAVKTIAFSPHGELLASGGSDDSVRLWDVRTGSVQKKLMGHNSDVTTLAFSPNGKLLASGAQYGEIILWDVSTGAKLQSLNGHEAAVSSVAFSPNGGILASGGIDKTIRLWTLDQR
jgi:WD40 repeat protein/tRNA A-37 threonylcarbamoyl transferase component Bud32